MSSIWQLLKRWRQRGEATKLRSPKSRRSCVSGSESTWDFLLVPCGRKSTESSTQKSLGIDPNIELRLSCEAIGEPIFQTLKFPDELEAIMEKISADARLAEQEMGLSTLYLAFGFLRVVRERGVRQERLLSAPAFTGSVGGREGQGEVRLFHIGARRRRGGES